MSTPKGQTSNKEIEKARHHFESWRKTKQHSSSPIPEELWQEAAVLARAHSIHEISRALRLDYNQLKRRALRSEARVESPTHSAPAFVELSLSAAMAVAQCTIELERPDKSRMAISIQGRGDLPWMELIKAFWSQP